MKIHGATLIVYLEKLKGGTEQTLLHCIRRKRPYKLLDASEISARRAAELASRFVQEKAVSTLNIAGHRASQAPGAHAYVYELTRQLIRR